MFYHSQPVALIVQKNIQLLTTKTEIKCKCKVLPAYLPLQMVYWQTAAPGASLTILDSETSTAMLVLFYMLYIVAMCQ